MFLKPKKKKMILSDTMEILGIILILNKTKGKAKKHLVALCQDHEKFSTNYYGNPILLQ